MVSNRFKLCEQHPKFHQTLICVQKGCNQLLCSECIFQHCVEHQQSYVFPVIKSLDILKESLNQTLIEVIKSLHEEITTIHYEESKAVIHSIEQAQEETILCVKDFFGRLKEEANFELRLMEEWKNSLFEKAQEYEALNSNISTEEVNSEILQGLATRDLNKELEDILVTFPRPKLLTLKQPVDLKEMINESLSKFKIDKEQKEEKEVMIEERETGENAMNCEEISILKEKDKESDEEEDMEDTIFQCARVQKIMQQLLFSSNVRHPNIEIIQDRHTVIRTKKKTKDVNICLGGLLYQGIHRLSIRINIIDQSELKNSWLAFGFVTGDQNVLLNQSAYQKAICICSHQTVHNIQAQEYVDMSVGVVYTIEADFLGEEVKITGENGLKCIGRINHSKGLIPFWEFKGDHRLTLLNYVWWEY